MGERVLPGRGAMSRLRDTGTASRKRDRDWEALRAESETQVQRPLRVIEMLNWPKIN